MHRVANPASRERLAGSIPVPSAEVLDRAANEAYMTWYGGTRPKGWSGPPEKNPMLRVVKNALKALELSDEDAENLAIHDDLAAASFETLKYLDGPS